MKVNCDYDEFSEDNIYNQIIVSTIKKILQYDKLTNREELARLLPYFTNVSLINLKTVVFANLRYTKTNSRYYLPISVCQMVIDELIPSDENSNKKMLNQLSDNALSRIFEKFILGYYQTRYPEYNANADEIKWHSDDGTVQTQHLFTMHSDVTLTIGDYILILDAKFYKSILCDTRFQSERYNMANFYQIYTYVSNTRLNNPGKKVCGCLLYAKTTNENVEFEVNKLGETIVVDSIDLSTNVVIDKNGPIYPKLDELPKKLMSILD